MFFSPLFDPECEVRISGPPALGGSLINRLARYISAPLAPVEIRELPAQVRFDVIPGPVWSIGPARIQAELVNHRGPTLGYRITDGEVTVAYIPDHEPGLGQNLNRCAGDWISGLELARGADLLIHDCQYKDVEYATRVGWGHSAVSDGVAFARRSGVRRLVAFHHDPEHDDAAIDAIIAEARARDGGTLEQITAAAEQHTIELR